MKALGCDNGQSWESGPGDALLVSLLEEVLWSLILFNIEEIEAVEPVWSDPLHHIMRHLRVS
jgi:hypothetical protein